MKIAGYKCFNKDLINRYGKKFVIGEIYVTPGILKYGNGGNGFHLCKNIEDTFRFFDTSKKDICVCEVIGSGNFIKRDDIYYGYFDMYCVEKMEIIRQLTRKEIIEEGLKLNEERVKRFISTLSLTEEEIKLFKNKFNKYSKVLDAISYYQENDKGVYYRKTNFHK